MDSLIDSCKMLSLHECVKDIHWYNNTFYNLYANMDNYNEFHVYSSEFIQNGYYIGEIIGEKKYSWEIVPSPNIIWIDDECALDCSEKPHCITSLLQESFYEGLIPNCEMFVYMHHHQTKVGLSACKDIHPNDELIFKKTMNCY